MNNPFLELEPSKVSRRPEDYSFFFLGHNKAGKTTVAS